MNNSHLLLTLNSSSIRNFGVVNESANKGEWKEETPSDLLTKAAIDAGTNDSLIRTGDTNYSDSLGSSGTMETNYNKKYSDNDQSGKRNENLDSSTVKLFPGFDNLFSSNLPSRKSSLFLPSNLSTIAPTPLNLTTDFHRSSTESMKHTTPNLVLESSITKGKNEYLERRKSKMKQKARKHDHFEKKKLRVNSITKSPINQKQNYLTSTEQNLDISNFDSIESIQDDDPMLHEETSEFGIPLQLGKIGLLQENPAKRNSNNLLINNINTTSHSSVDLLYQEINPPTPQSLSRVIPHLETNNEISTKEPISLKRYTTSRSPLIKQTTDSILASNHGSNISVCSDDPCGAGVACHPTGKGFLCFCSDGTEVAPREPCPDIRPVNVTPPAISMPQANESLMRPSQVLILGSVITMALCIFGVIGLVYFRRNRICKIMRQRNALKLNKSASESVVKISTLHTYNFASNPNYYTSPPDQLPLQSLSVQLINKSQITFLGDLGEGCFGRVYKGEYDAKSNSEFDDDSESQFSSTYDESDLENKEPKDENKISKKKKKKKTVAVKVLKELVGVEAEADFMREVEIMASFRHPNILSLIGIVVEADTGGTPWMVFEFMPYGDLAEVLRSCNQQYGKNYAPVKSLGKMELLNICIQVAAGMEYLSQQHFVHRDLACRNCLVGKNLTVKISDFGMSRDVYTCDYYKVGGSRMLPVRWMAPESILYGKFTLESDVWSFGVVLWEIYSFGKQPYYGNSNEEVVQLILQGILLSPCESCPPLVREVMRLCWCTEAQNRLTFPDIVERLQRAQESLEEDLLCQELFQHINYSRLSMHDTQGTLQTDKDQYLLPKKNVVTDEYLTVLGNL